MILINKYLNGIFISGIRSLLKIHNIPESYVSILWKELSITVSARTDYQCNGMIRFLQVFKQQVTDQSQSELCADHTVDQLIQYVIESDINESKIIDSMEPCKNFINIVVNNQSISDSFWTFGVGLFNNGLNMCNHGQDQNENKKQILVDYSSPNVAKSLHIGHLRSTIIGHAIKNLLLTQDHNVIGVNHIGDWGTQFGMIINLLKTKYSENDLLEYITNSDSNDLMNIYREAKLLFDSDPLFSDNSRKQTHLLQQGDPFNRKIWEKICAISSNEYQKIYKILNVNDLIERGESFYQPLIPQVINKLESLKLLQDHEGAKIILLDHWTYPLIVVKSDGGYTYDTTDLAALYHRLQLINMDQIIYVTDIGQKSHFDMCFEVAELMGWTTDTNRNIKKTLTHIGFGLVLGKDGKKLKTRSGDVVKMQDVMNEVTQKAVKCVAERASSETVEAMYYQGMTIDCMDSLSQKIGMNTLKYFDFTHSHSSNYKYDPELMFSFNGNTGVYLMYSYARITGIIEKSSYRDIDRKNIHQVTDFLNKLNNTSFERKPLLMISKETKKLIIHCVNLSSMLEDAVNTLDINKIVKYLHMLCTCFNTFNSQKNGKIIGSHDESYGIGICIIVSKIIDSLFNVLSLESVDHI